MPIYVYECEECKRVFNMLQGINDKTLEKHADCTEGHDGLKETCKGKIKRIIQPPSISVRKGTPKFFKR